MGNCQKKMRINNTFGILAIVLLACNDYQQKSYSKNEPLNSVTFDTVIGSKNITDEIAGSSYRKRATGYFLIIGKDTSDYTCIFSETKEKGSVIVDLNIPYLKASMTYRQRLHEIKSILTRAEKEYNFDSITSISLGRLILNGDLAIDVTNNYYQKFGTNSKLESYSNVRKFLKESKLGADMNDLFKPYSILVDEVSIEKLFFTSRKELLWASKIETDTLSIPDKILDCIVWIRLTRK